MLSVAVVLYNFMAVNSILKKPNSKRLSALYHVRSQKNAAQQRSKHCPTSEVQSRPYGRKGCEKTSWHELSTA